ncbi:putative Polycomb group protein ASXL2 isoform X1 [Gouania willdenowi]|uniref:putative Polycomb group protein ASXL2 isoform X1 n=1 Tax=Gouania willdenowi TaxID=441366 RepID=UPI001054FEA5|nr:putative Polycomb group protein ASXL2 isoform X1 [Gouania willdenowi]
MRERQRKKKGRTWAEAAKTVLEKYPNTPMSHKEILQVIQRERLKEIRSGTSPLACLNAMLHTNSRGKEGLFYKVPGRMGVYTLKKDISDVVKELSDEASEDSSDDLSDSRSSENNSSAISEEGRMGRWMRRVPSKLQSQPTSPQPRCSSPSVPTTKIISPSQKHSKKALKQALKQQQQRNQRRQGGMPSASSPRLLLKTIKDMADTMTTKTDLCHPVVPRKVSHRSSRLSAGQIKRTKCTIDVETPDSILVNTNLRALINKHTFSVLPPECQQRLLQLLPEVDRQACLDGLLKVTSSALNNEFFTSAAQSWKERLAEGEFTPELQLRLRQEIEKEKKVEHWKEAFFENYYGENSGLSYENSEELTNADLNQKSVSPMSSPHQMEPRALVAKKSDCTKDSKHTAADMKLIQEPLKTQCFPVAEPMKTRRQHSEDCRLNKAKQAEQTPVVRTPEVEKQTECQAASTTPEKQQEDMAEDKIEVPQSPLKKIPTLKPGSELKVEPVTPTGPAPEPGEVVFEASSPPDVQKRKSLSETEGELTPEKRPRLSSVSSVSSVSPSASSISSPATPSPTANQRVPPLKIPVSRILSVPGSPSQVSARSPLPTPLSSPGRTGARTLADIKAKAQQARAQRAAAAAAAVSSALKGAVPGPGPGGGASEQVQCSPSPSPTSLHPSTRVPSTSSLTSTPAPSPVGSVGQLSPNQSQRDDKHMSHPAAVGKAGPDATAQSSIHVTKEQEILSAAGSSGRSSSCISANNPLVTQLLQGKEVPLEQILPKPLSKTEVATSSLPLSNKCRIPNTAEHGTNKQICQQVTTVGKAAVFPEFPKHHRELPDQETQQQILQTLMQRKAQQNQPYKGLGLHPPQYDPPQLMRAEQQDQSKISLGFLGQKRRSRPAMTGHYLLNVSTYGRGSESKRHQSVIPNTTLSVLKTESTDGDVSVKEEESSRNSFSSVTKVKLEQQGYPIYRCEDAESLEPQASVKTESGSDDNDTSRTSAPAKDTSAFSQPRRRQLELGNRNQGNPEPYLTHMEPSHQRATAYHTQRTLGYQEPVPHSLNHSTVGATSSTSDAEAVHGSVMSFSVTVTTIPAGHSLDHGSQGEPSSQQSFMDRSDMGDVQSKCYCRLKAMIVCKGCGAFCHDDCIGPSKLCVSCLVVR